ncbi:glycosyltransferase family 2 protein [Helicobacter sp. 23-1044]
MLPKISIITATLNSAKTLLRTIDSVLLQEYKNIEHIIIDGKSDDGSLAIIQNAHKLYEQKGISLIFISECDKGIYDAMNKGINLANGEIVGFLNADDCFASPYIANFIAWGFSKPNAVDIIYADICYVNKCGNIARNMCGTLPRDANFMRGFHPAHPSFYARREVFARYGAFDLRYKISADYDLMLRFLFKYKLKSLYIDEIFVKMSLGGTSNKSLKNIIKANLECLQSAKENGVKCASIAILLKIISKLKDINYRNLFAPPPICIK